MTLQVRCTTRFDITVTDVRNNFSRSRLPFHDATGFLIQDLTSWNRSRNQQRNWETINQIISLRILPENITKSYKITQNSESWWVFEFLVVQVAAIEFDKNPVGMLYKDCQDVPMLTGLDEDVGQQGRLIPKVNVYFAPVIHK